MTPAPTRARLPGLRLLLPSVLLLLLALPGAGGAQVPFTAVGLGYPVPPTDGRSAALGGASVGLVGGTAAARNPADLALFRNAVLSVSVAPEEVDLLSGGESQSFGQSRFSVLRVAVPLGSRWSISGAFKSELDQDWEILVRDTLNASGNRFPFEERRRSTGGLGAFEFSIARSLGDLSVAVSGERMLGGLDQSFRRRFEPDSTGGTVVAPPGNVASRARWEYAGWRVRAGASFQVGDRARLGATASWATEMEAEPKGDAETREFDLPRRLEAGASVLPTEDLLVTASAGWSGWSEMDADLRDVGAEDTRWVGAGVELRSLSVGPVPLQVRAGGRLAELPFVPGGGEQATERSLSVGLGVQAARGRGLVDAALQIGSRGDVRDVGLEEDFRRLTLSFTLVP